MAHDIDREIAELRQLTVEQLRARHQQVSGTPVRSPHKEHLPVGATRDLQPETPDSARTLAGC